MNDALSGVLGSDAVQSAAEAQIKARIRCKQATVFRGLIQ